MKYVLTLAGFAAWGWIVQMAYDMADARIALCGRYDAEACIVRTTAARDNVLVQGYTVALVAAIVLAALWISRARGRAHPSASLAERVRRLP